MDVCVGMTVSLLHGEPRTISVIVDASVRCAEAVVDASVRRAMQIDAEFVCTPAQRIPRIHLLAEDAVKSLGLPKIGVRPQLYKLLLL